MNHHLSISTDHYQRIFESSPASFLILLPDADFTIVAVTEDYLRDTLTERENILGKPLFDVFPDNPVIPESHSTGLLAESFRRVIATKSVDTMALLRYDIPKPDGTGFEERYWRPVNKATLSPDGEILYIIHRAQDVTDFVQLLAENKAHERERAELTAQKMIMEKEVQYRSMELAAKNAELTSTNEVLKQYTDQMRDEARRKDEFLAMLAHELRNPLAPIAAAADLLGLGHPDEARIKQTSGIIRRQVKHMTGLVDDLLDVSRVTRGLVTLDKTKLDAKRILSDAVEQVRPLIEARGHRLALHTPPESAFVSGDEKRLVQVVTNLLTNAAKFTPEGGDIVLSMEVDGSHIKIVVSDNGVGMTTEFQARAFELFAQAAQTSDRSQGGLGIGLALVKSLMELHGGSVTVQSDGVGKGSRFVVCLPNLLEKQISANLEPQALNTDDPSKAVRVMIVDDNADAAQMLAMLIEALGHQVLVEHHPRRALERAQIETPDVFLLDIGLPDMDGNELARRLRMQPETTKAILIAVTGYGQEQDRDAALNAGFDHYFAKPMDSAKLASLLAEINNN
ncbi:ATP-binding protein [Herbaspirillum sp. GCM10030257]|uniref:hybrid sensor histidine kinase/response regulator n=1 Tax=Herbaspirillum sp. GCM10030257 TaxID=3273393 RepID=UPI00360F1881